MPEQTTVQLSQHAPFTSALRDQFLHSPAKFLRNLQGLGDDWLKWKWEETGKRRAEEDCPGVEHVDLPSDAICSSTHDLKHGVEAVVVTLPEPNITCDPYFVAFVTPPPGVKMAEFGGGGSDGPRCFQLEASNHDRPFVCEWSPDGQEHRNYVSVGEPTLEAFLGGLRRMVVG